MSKLILDSSLHVPFHMVPSNAFDDFQCTILDRDKNEINYKFYVHDPEKDEVRFARGNIPLLQKYFDWALVDDKRASPTMSVSGGLQFTKTLRENQAGVVNELLDKRITYGQIKAPPRFGKTVTMTYLTCKWGLKTLFFAHQIDLSKQALKTFYDMTNLLDLEYELGRPIAGIVEEWEDLDKYDIAFMPYQKFVTGTNAEEMLAKYKDRFGVLFVDESHRGSAERYSQIISSFNSLYRIGVSGTTERKNEMHLINNFVIGPVVVTGSAPQVPCKVITVHTGIEVPYRIGTDTFFLNMLNYLATSEIRNKLILDTIYNFARAGHSIIAVGDRVQQCNIIANTLCKDYSIRAEPFHAKAFKSKKQREECLERTRRGQTQVLIALRSMVLGLDIPRLTVFLNLLPTNNKPNYYQEFSRVRTPYEGKDFSYVIDFVDKNVVAFGCYKSRVTLYKEHSFESLNQRGTF